MVMINILEMRLLLAISRIRQDGTGAGVSKRVIQASSRHDHEDSEHLLLAHLQRPKYPNGQNQYARVRY